MFFFLELLITVKNPTLSLEFVAQFFENYDNVECLHNFLRECGVLRSILVFLIGKGINMLH